MFKPVLIHTVHKFFWPVYKIKSTNFICFFSLFFPFTVCFVLFFYFVHLRDIHDPLSSEIISSWFKASYLGINNGTSRHTIKYNAQGSFPECQCEVIFLSNSRLLDCNENDALLWRHEGKPWIADENDEEFGASLIKEQDVSGNEVTMTMQELLEDQMHMDLIEHGGNSLEGMGMNAMGQLPYMQQVRVVSGYRDFATALKAKLKSIQDSKGEGALVTEKDIQSFMADLRKK